MVAALGKIALYSLGGVAYVFVLHTATTPAMRVESVREYAAARCKAELGYPTRVTQAELECSDRLLSRHAAEIDRRIMEQ